MMLHRTRALGVAAARLLGPSHGLWFFRFCLCLALFAAAAEVRAGSSAAQGNSPAGAGNARPLIATAKLLRLEYHLRIPRPSTHLAEIEIDAAGASAPALDFAMPAWSPGRYAIYDFAKNVQEFSATGADGQPLAWSQPDKQTWRVETGGQSDVRVRYQVYANDLNGSFSQIDSTHANLNGASIFMYVAGHKPDPVHLTVSPPGGESEEWKVVGGYSLDPNARTFEAPNYDRLIDTPLEISPAVTIDSFTDHGKTFRVAVHDYASDEDSRPALVKSLVDGVHKIVAAEMAMMPEPDFDQYTFLFHFAPEIASGDGMEHLNSTQIIVSQPLSDSAVDEALTDAAHEFFHAWNVKRLRPAALGPFDYSREDYTSSLWFAEGVTSYYSYITMLRTGLWTKDEFLARLAAEIGQLEGDPGRSMMSAESSSFHAWFYDRSPQMQETNFANSTISYYNKGAILGMLLDLDIREATGGRKSLDDVMQLMYGRFYGAATASYYLPGRGYEEGDVLQALDDAGGGDFSGFFTRYVQGVQPLPYSEVLAKAGLTIKRSAEPGAAPSLGVLTRPATTGVQITEVAPNGAADRAGLSRDDLLVAVDNFSLATASLEDRLKIYPPGTEVPFTVQRHAERRIVTVKLDPPFADQISVEETPNAPPDAVRLRQGWLSSGTRSASRRQQSSMGYPGR